MRELPEPDGYLCDWGNDLYGLPRIIVYYGGPGSATEDDWNEFPKVHQNTPIFTRDQVMAIQKQAYEDGLRDAANIFDQPHQEYFGREAQDSILSLLTASQKRDE